MKLFSFLGTGDYEEATYSYENEKLTTLYAPIATAFFIKPESFILFLTEEAEKKHLFTFKEELNRKVPFIKFFDVRIPSGFTEEERWEIWEKVIRNVEEGEEVAFDLTHSYRTIPFYTFFAIQFLKYLKNIELKGVFYGAFEYPGEIKPCIKINEVFYILDWFYYTSYFIKTGLFLEEAKKHIIPPSQSFALPKNLENIINLLREISFNIHFIQVNSLKEKIREFKKKELLMEKNIPFFAIYSYIQKEYARLEQNIFGDINILEWLFEKGHYIQVLLLLEEEIIDKLANQEKKREWKERKITRKALNNGKKIFSNHPVIKIWVKVNQLRNMVAHCGFVESTKIIPEDTIKKIKEAIDEYKKIDDEIFISLRKELKKFKNLNHE